MGLIRLLAIVGGVYLAWRLFSRYVFPFLGRYFVRKASQKMQETMQEQMRTRQDGKTIYKDGDVTIRKSDRAKDGQSGDSGEYVDYEEV